MALAAGLKNLSSKTVRLIVIGIVSVTMATAGQGWAPVLPAGTQMKASLAQSNSLQKQQTGSFPFSQVQQTPQAVFLTPQQQQQLNQQLQKQQQLPAALGVRPQQLIQMQQLQQQLSLLVQTLRSLGLNVLAALIQGTNPAALQELFAQPNSLKTILAPSDDAFNLMPRTMMTRLQQQPMKVAKMLRYHLLPGTVGNTVIGHDIVVNTFLPDKRIRFNVYHIGGTTRVTANGVLISRLNALQSGPLTLHVLDRVLFPVPRGDITTTIFGDNCTVFEGMSTALIASALDEFFRTNAPGISFTVFMPTTQAFQLVPKASLNSIIEDPEKVAALVLSHTVNGTFYSQGLRDGQWLTTASKYEVPIWVGVVSEGNSRRLDSVNGQVRVLQADIPADNGVIHLIDRPINPMELVNLLRCESDLIEF